MSNLNIWNKWGKLKTVMLGDHYRAEFFDPIKDVKVRDSLKRIADETQEDLEGYERVLKDFGCEVLRPPLDHSQTIMDHVNINGQVSGHQGVPRSPLQVRDGQFVAGNTLYFTMGERGIWEHLERRYKNNHVMLNWLTPDENIDMKYRTWDQKQFYDCKQWIHDDYGTYKQYKEDPNYFNNLPADVSKFVKKFHMWNGGAVDAPSWTLVGRDLYVDAFDREIRQSQKEKILEHIPNVRMHILHHGGHSDGCFHTIKPGALISLLDIQNYEETFPGWDICYLPDQSWDKVDGFMQLKSQVGGKWWVPGEENNDELTSFVETWLQDWVGYVEETVFDVNVLVLDEHHVCVSQIDNPIINEFLKKHKMEPVHVPWRHRYFWDGGLHCITLDLEREGVQEDYFPDRGNTTLIDYGFD